ncbi:MAG: hypothetical protein KDB07_06865, partial [Planctomycetes bacterium]|nr:hypothetical protein [Planctomycetota bacterium]
LWAMVVVNTTSLLKQWADAAYESLGYEAGIIQQDVVQWRPLTIAMIHTLATGRFHTAEELKHYGAVFFDEAHHLAAPTFNQVCPLFYGRRYGLTATKKRADGMESLYMYHLGPNIYSDLTMQEIPYVYFVRTGLQLNEAQRKSITRKGTINQSLLQGLLGRTPWRNALILELIADLRAKGRKILVLGHLKDHLRLLHTNCPGSGLVIGDVDPNERAAVVDQSDVTFGTIKLAAEGFDAPALDTLIVMTPFSHEGMVQQALGRISRTMAGKQRPEAYFIEDRIKSCVEMMVSVRHYLASVDVGSEFLDYARSLEPMYREMAEEFDRPLTY